MVPYLMRDPSQHVELWILNYNFDLYQKFFIKACNPILDVPVDVLDDAKDKWLFKNDASKHSDFLIFYLYLECLLLNVCTVHGSQRVWLLFNCWTSVFDLPKIISIANLNLTTFHFYLEIFCEMYIFYIKLKNLYVLWTSFLD